MGVLFTFTSTNPFKFVCGVAGVEVTVKRGKWPSKRMMVTIRGSLFDSVIAHLTGSCKRDDGPAPLLESATVMRWPPITARPLSSQLLAFLVKIIALFLPQNGRFQWQIDLKKKNRRKCWEMIVILMIYFKEQKLWAKRAKIKQLFFLFWLLYFIFYVLF